MDHVWQLPRQETSSRILVVYGTRPEEIKLWPLRGYFYAEVDQSPDLHQGLIKPDIRVTEAQLPGLIGRGWEGVIVQGDTRTAYRSAIHAFSHNIPVFHVEAGLRTGDLKAPYPEEGYRAIIDAISSRLYCPTQESFNNLGRHEQERAVVTGQTGIDTLLAHAPAPTMGDTVIVTLHRGEANIEKLADEILTLTHNYPLLSWRVFAHPNAKGQYLKTKLPTEQPLPYKEFVHLLASCRAVVTDSGGLQEECAALGKPCLVLRDKTERAYPGMLLGSASDFEQLTVPTVHPFGDGHAADRIMEDIRAYRFHRQPSLHV